MIYRETGSALSSAHLLRLRLACTINAMAASRSTDASVEPALDALRAQQESSMLFAAYATNATGHVTNAHTNWELGEATTDAQACGKLTCSHEDGFSLPSASASLSTRAEPSLPDFCKVANVRCIRDSEEDM
jgi:hypothetical protein